MKNFRTVSLIAILFLLLCRGGFAQNYEHSLEICERYYEDGDYQKALDECNRVIRQLKKASLGYAVSEFQMNQAKYYEAMGEYIRFEETLRESLNSKKVKGENTRLYGTAVLDAAALYAEYSNINKAAEYLAQAKQLLGVEWDQTGRFTKQPGDSYLRSKFLHVQARIHYSRGHIDQFLRLIDELARVRQERIVASEEYYNLMTDAPASRTLEPSEVKRRKVEYAEVLTLHGDALRLQGNYAAAEEKLKEADAWIRQHLSVRNLAYIRNQQAQTLLMVDSRADREQMRRMLEKNIYLAERVLTTVHKTYLQIHETLIDNYVDSRYFKKSSNPRWEYRKNTSIYYGAEKLQHAVAQRLDARKEFKSGDYASAAELLTALYKNPIKVPYNHIERINLLRQLYEVAIARDEYLNARQYLNELAETTGRILGRDAVSYQVARMELADYYTTYTNRFREVENIFAEAFYGHIVRHISEDHKDYVPFLNQLANYYQVVDKYDSSKVLLTKAIAIAGRRYGNNSIKYAIELEKLVELQMLQGNYTEADKNIKTILDIFKTQDTRAYTLEYSNALETAASYYATMGLYNQAQEALTRSNRLFKKSTTSIASSTAIDELAYLYIRMERYKDTEKMLNEAIDIRRSRYGDSSRFLINPYNQLARLKLINGEYLKADELVNKALNISTMLFGEKALRNVESITIISELNTAMGDYEKAKNEINRVIELQETNLGKQHIKLANSLTQLALIRFYNREKLEEVEKLLLEAEKIISTNLGKDNPIYAEALKNLALVYTENSKLLEAKVALEQAGDIWTKTLITEFNIHNAEIRALTGDIELKQGNYKAAEASYDVAMQLYAKKLSKSHPLYTNMLTRTARLFYISGELANSQKYMEEALQQYKVYIRDFFPALSDREKNKYWMLIRNDFEFYNNLIVKRATSRPALIGKIYDNTLLTKPLLLSSSIKVRNQIRSSSDTSLRNNYERWVAQKELLTQVISMSDEQQKEENLDAKKIQKQIDDLEKQLSRQSEIFRSTEEEKTWQQVKEALKAGEAAVEIIRYRYFDKTFTDSVVYAALLIKPGMKQPKFIPLPDSKKLESSYLKYYRNSIKFGVADPNSYKRFWEPIDKALTDAPKVYLSVEGAYTQINVETLLKTDSLYVIDEKNIVLMTTTKDLVRQPVKVPVTTMKPVTSRGVVLVGNPVFYKDLEESEYDRVSNRKITQLPGTQIEVRRINELFSSQNRKTELILTVAATEDTIKQLNSPVIFHIATHGFFEPDLAEDASESVLNNQKMVNNPLLRSGLLLRNAGDLLSNYNVYGYNRESGVLTAYEAMNLKLDNTDLVVLSACETGRGEVKVGEGVYGLQRSFQVAGAKKLVMSLFKVSDEATQLLMTYFYSNLQQNKDERTAFIEAKKELRKTFKEPIYWGAFIMIGTE